MATSSGEQGLMQPPRSGDRRALPLPAQYTAAWGLYLLLAALAVVCLATLREGHSWGDDFALYILHARNLAEGRAYGDTGFVYNPSAPLYSPQVYPPGFPLLLAPLYAAFGVHLLAFRMVVVASFVGAVAVFALFARSVLPPRIALATAALVAFQPFLLRFKNLLLPDFTFLLFIMVTLYCVLRAVEEEEDGWRSRHILWGALGGVSLAIAISMRTIGITFFGGLVLYQVLRRQVPRVPVLVFVAVVLVLYGLLSQLMPPASGYAAQLADTVSAHQPRVADRLLRMIRSAWALLAGTDVLWSATGEQRAPNHEGVARALIRLLMGGTGLLVLAGYWLRLKRVSIVETFVIAYVGSVIVWGATPARYLVPVIPFLLYYAVVGFSWLTNRGPRPVKTVAYAFGVLVILSYAINVVRLDRSPYANGVTGRDARELFDHVQRCTPADGLLASSRPRALVLFTGRRATPIGGSVLDNQERLLGFIDGVGVGHLVVSPREQRLAQIAAERPDALTPAFQNASWVVYRAHTTGASAGAAPGGDCADMTR
jgi:4-amino-4-deoxy-L-arabinose transferase-like glycosyltransferase